MGERHYEAEGQATELEEMKKIPQKFLDESKKMWKVALPCILCAVSIYSISFVTSAFVGHVGDVELAAVSMVQNVIEGFAFGVMLGMGSALETLCGQAVGAKQFNMLGICMQRSWIITGATALILTPFYVFASPLLKLLHQDKSISDLAQKYSRWVIPQLFAYALNFPIQKFLQSQSKVWIIYVFSGFFPDAWTGFSPLAFKSLAGFLKLSLSSAVMLCLELWYYTAVILMVGGLKNPAVSVDAVSICINLETWILMIAMGFNAAVSVRVSNELGAGNPKAAKFSMIVTGLTSMAFGVLFATAIIATKNDYTKLFTKQPLVVRETSKLGYFLAASIFLDSIQLVLHGVAVGAGWQSVVALISIGCYYIVGLPFGALLGYGFHLGVKGILAGMLVGGLLQVIIFFWFMNKKNLNKEALIAEEHVKTWGGVDD